MSAPGVLLANRRKVEQMRSRALAILVALSSVLCNTSQIMGEEITEIRYELADLGSDRWQYTYGVINHTLAAGIEEFTIWFDYGMYDDLVVTTSDPLSGDWDEIVWQVEPVLKDAGGYDALENASNLAIGIGETVSGFAVRFDWLGEEAPGSQFYEIIDPTTFDTIDSGWTTPEPASLCLLGLGAIVLRKRGAV